MVNYLLCLPSTLTRQDGSLAVSGGRDLATIINGLLGAPGFDFRVATQDYHPKSHVSFASNHPPPNNKPFESFVDVRNHVGGKPEETMQQRLWPDHCIQGTNGSRIIDEIDTSKVDLTLQKGMDERVEMYSAFIDSFGQLTAGSGGVSHDLAKILSDRGTTDVYVVGLAGDYCVKATAQGAAAAGFRTFVIEEAQRCVDQAAWGEVVVDLKSAGVKVVHLDGEEVQKIR